MITKACARARTNMHTNAYAHTHAYIYTLYAHAYTKTYIQAHKFQIVSKRLHLQTIQRVFTASSLQIIIPYLYSL